MSGFFDHVERELVAAAARAASPPWYRRLVPAPLRGSRRAGAVVLVGVILLAVPAGARVTGAWDTTPAEPAPGSGIVAGPGEPLVDVPGEAPPLVDPPPGGDAPPGDAPPPAPVDRGDNVVEGGSCVIPGDPEPAPLTDERPPRDVLDMLGMLRRPRRANDGFPPRFREFHGPANPGYARLARTTETGGRYYLTFVTDLHRRRPLPDTPECERFRRHDPPPQPAVCLTIIGDGGGGTCQTAANIRRGLGLLSGDHIPGQRPGTVNVSAIVPDGVERVTLRYPQKAPVRTVSGEVVGNVFTATFNGSAAVEPRVFWHMADGRVREIERPG